MVEIANLNLPTNPPKEVTLNQTKFNAGVITVVNDTDLPANALAEATNILLKEKGTPVVRPGVDWYGTAPSSDEIDGGGFFVTDADVIHLLCIAGGTVYRSLDNAQTWTACTGATLTPGWKVGLEQGNSFAFLFNGFDNLVRYDGTTTLQTYTVLSAPTGNTPSKTGLGGTTIQTLRYRVAAVNDVGFTEASAAVTIGVDRDRTSFDDSNYLTFTWSAVANAVRYDIYEGITAGEESYVASVDGGGTTTYVDKGTDPEQIGIEAPDTNTTGGPKAGDVALVGTRLYATRDKDFPFRVWISAAGRYLGRFSSAYDATYIDLQKGSRFKPVKVVDYRNGKGDPLATVWCRSADGLGCIWQGSLDSFTVGTITFPVPNFYKLPGSRGTEAQHSIINVLNDYIYYNSQAIFNLGSRAQFLNLLSTDEFSANIRPDVQKITQSAADKIAGHFQDAKIYISIPTDTSTENNVTMVYDTERKAWLPRAFTIGFERFFSYTDTDGNRHLLCWKNGDTKFSEISDDFKGDYGEAFATSLTTGLMSVNPQNRFDFMWCDRGEIELAETQQPITVQLQGTSQLDGFKKLAERTITPSTTKVSWTLFPWTTRPWTDTSVNELSYSEPSLKRYFDVQEDINNWQYRITTNSFGARYLLRTLQVSGTASEAGMPMDWELFD